MFWKFIKAIRINEPFLKTSLKYNAEDFAKMISLIRANMSL